ncbi:tRNA (adenosine(37)-N6)-threonylcarbamoyltransferase complex dimerization subunit type 1 TsaB [Paucibacter sp. Y2R2-4]|uniref:tRNA (adenosine(37)-N6)-threonylcarbamoyltransferase complex dimerization subunit type 1 TsaB n=1 Tax=Paucibacter sp. Y2R2-4 TaxID=2893553 RepID=UPI0021E4AC01|nr:tRNA (adenosine(37)-N6)-threonylcarbamoyltransferase complex dimerization subunit type 1 TsaB [Paucibacter sp. Y2R2-4]MCV2352343.1 tRNA (adenosine(37)-N6)-threonylcarbamoyltransferase complex dimerization subunit type 1 TsaB [Paucibacter sp. Y2R2-4]
MTVLLALDSSTETMALSLTSPAGRWLFESDGGPQASSRLVPEALALLAQAGLKLADVDAIAFGRGPGAFTGLRAACAVVQGLAFGAGKPVLAIDSLMLVAEDARQQAGAAFEGLMWVAMDARMGEIYAGAYRWVEGAWQQDQAPMLYSPESLMAHWGQPTALCGSALTVFADQLAPALQAPTQSWPRHQSRAAALAALAAQAWTQGALLDAAEAMPIYVRDKVAQTTAERMALREQAAAS